MTYPASHKAEVDFDQCVLATDSGTIVSRFEPDTVVTADCTVVAMKFAAVTHLDLSVLAGRIPGQLTTPFVPGTEGVGRIVSSPHHAAGTRVVVRGCGVGVGRPGLWSTHVAVPHDAVHPCPDRLPDTAAAAALAPASTAYAAVVDIAEVQAGQKVAVTGTGGVVGDMCANLAAARGATVIEVHVKGRARRVRSTSPAAPHIAADREVLEVDLRSDGPVALPNDVDVVIDTVGGQLAGVLIPMLRLGGRLVVLGYTAGNHTAVNLFDLITGNRRILPVNMQGRQPSPDRVADALHAVGTGVLPLETTTYPMDRIADAVAHVERGTAGRRVVLDLQKHWMTGGI